MDTYTPNSHKYREAQARQEEKKKEIKKVGNGVVSSKKKSDLRKLTDVFIKDDIHTVLDCIWKDYVVPNAKTAILETVNMLLNGTDAPRKTGNSNGRTPYTSYYKSQEKGKTTENGRSKTKSVYDYDNIEFTDRGEAEMVLKQMDDILEQYDTVSVADFYEMAGVSSTETDQRYGWDTIANAKVVRLANGGYMVRLPRAIPLD